MKDVVPDGRSTHKVAGQSGLDLRQIRQVPDLSRRLRVHLLKLVDRPADERSGLPKDKEQGRESLLPVDYMEHLCLESGVDLRRYCGSSLEEDHRAQKVGGPGDEDVRFRPVLTSSNSRSICVAPPARV